MVAFVYTIEVTAVLIMSARVLQSGSLRDFTGPMPNSGDPVSTENAVVALFENVSECGRFGPVCNHQRGCRSRRSPCRRGHGVPCNAARQHEARQAIRLRRARATPVDGS